MNKKIIFIWLLIAWSLLPIVWQIYTSFCTPEALINNSITARNHWTLSNYKQILFADPPFWQYLLNSTIVGLTSTFLTLLLSIPAAYSLIKIRKSISKLFKIFLFGGALFPYVLLFLALLEIARKFNLSNNLVALSFPYAALSMPLAILLLSSAFRDLPKDLEDAAKIEGLGLFARLRWIFIPLLAPAIGSTSILVFLFSWNEYPIALTWISQANLLTLPVAISRIAGSSVYEIPYGAYAAATVLGAFPLVLIVLVFQRQIVSGLTKGAIKG
tara:strand:+ start:173 stop:988 length:816 start_codon:yes stop_codon:yes gene_type:complete